LFRPLLTFHILVVTIGLILAVYMIALGFRTSVKRGAERRLEAGSPRGTALRFTGWALLASVVLPMVLFGVRVLFTEPTIGKFLGWLISGVLVGLGVIAIEWVGRAVYPDGERRHRAIGTFTMILYVLALLTSTATYVLLYVIWPPLIG
jgi:uncharacterized membrane protein YozB (DUF420 family)